MNLGSNTINPLRTVVCPRYSGFSSQLLIDPMILCSILL